MKVHDSMIWECFGIKFIDSMLNGKRLRGFTCLFFGINFNNNKLFLNYFY